MDNESYNLFDYLVSISKFVAEKDEIYYYMMNESKIMFHKQYGSVFLNLPNFPLQEIPLHLDLFKQIMLFNAYKYAYGVTI